MSTKKIIGGTGITSGGDVTFGDVSGQFAIGENITQTQTFSAVFPDITIPEPSYSPFNIAKESLNSTSGPKRYNGISMKINLCNTATQGIIISITKSHP